MKRFVFQRLHHPTGERSHGEFDARDTAQALASINAYNSQSARVMRGEWLYWIAESDLDGHPV